MNDKGSEDSCWNFQDDLNISMGWICSRLGATYILFLSSILADFSGGFVYCFRLVTIAFSFVPVAFLLFLGRLC